MCYNYERLVNLLKDVNGQWENVVRLGFNDMIFEAGIQLCRRLLLGALMRFVVRESMA